MNQAERASAELHVLDLMARHQIELPDDAAYKFAKHVVLVLRGADDEDESVSLEEACKVMHDAYEAAAPAAGWETQEASRKEWDEVPEANKRTMRSAVEALLIHLKVPHGR